MYKQRTTNNSIQVMQTQRCKRLFALFEFNRNFFTLLTLLSSLFGAHEKNRFTVGDTSNK